MAAHCTGKPIASEAIDDERTSPRLEQLLLDGVYRNEVPEAAGSVPMSHTAPAPEAGVLLSKPELVMTQPMLVEIDRRLTARGYLVREGRVIVGAEVEAQHLIRRHYHAHIDVALHGGLSPSELRRLAEVYDVAGLASLTDVAFRSIPVENLIRFEERTGVTIDRLAAWAAQIAERRGMKTGAVDVCNEVGDLVNVQLVAPPSLGVQHPSFVINPQMPTIIRWWEEAVDPIVALVIEPYRSSPVPWQNMRADFLGVGGAARWPAGSLRGDLRDGTLPVRLRAGLAVSTAHNGFHLSSGSVETLREISIWFGRDPRTTAIGRCLAAHDVDVGGLLDHAYVDIDGDIRGVIECTSGLELEAAARLLSNRVLLSAAQAAAYWRAAQQAPRQATQQAPREPTE